MDTIRRPIRDTQKFSARRLGELVRAARLETGLTLEEAAELSGHFSVKAFSAIERGRRRASTHDLLLIAELYGVDPLSLMIEREVDRVELDESLHTSAVTSLEIQEVLAAYLAALHGFRPAGPSSIFQLRDDDLAKLGTRLEVSRTRLLRELRNLMRLAAAVNSAVHVDLEGGAAAETGSAELALLGADDGAAPALGPLDRPPAPGTALAIFAPPPELLDAGRAAELERIYDELYHGAHRRRFFGRRKHQARCDELRRRQQHLLEEVGCESWTDYMLKVSVTPACAAEWRPAPLAITAGSLPVQPEELAAERTEL